jgi:hypothetical protein
MYVRGVGWMKDPASIARIMKDRIRGMGRKRIPRGIGDERRVDRCAASEYRRRGVAGVEEAEE